MTSKPAQVENSDGKLVYQYEIWTGDETVTLTTKAGIASDSLVKKGVVSAEDIDAVMKYGLAFRWACIGPLETMDFGGIDTFYHVSSYLMKDLDDSHEIPTLLKEHYEKGELGVKTKKGFYDYSNGKDKEATERRNEKLLKVFNVLYKTL